MITTCTCAESHQQERTQKLCLVTLSDLLNISATSNLEGFSRRKGDAKRDRKQLKRENRKSLKVKTTYWYINCPVVSNGRGGVVASWLVRSPPERAVQARALGGDIVLCSWARHFTLTVPRSTQVCKWVLANCWGNLTKLWGSDLQWTSIPSRGSRNTSTCSRFMLQKLG